MKHALLRLSLFAILSTAPIQASIQHLRVDTANSTFSFEVRHYLHKMGGCFEKFQGHLDFDKDTVINNRATFTVQADSINTHNKDRDERFLTDDYLAVDSYPNLEFESLSWLQKDTHTYEVFGYLTMIGKRMPVTVDVHLISTTTNANQKLIYQWHGKGKIDRTDWGMRSGLPTLSRDVTFDFMLTTVEE